ncbi:MAG: DUF4081 domain-containing protein, partial [Candidatus Eremiobacteraeota bacterium]|nr:DUF4081 domain-containing protein [Candidatus Eremiobacteraeota bacterium]
MSVTGKMRLERISPATERAALAFLERAPYDNVFITYLLLHEFSAVTRAKVVVVLDADSAVRGVGYYGRQLAIAAEDEALDALAEHAKRHRGDRMIIGPRAAVSEFWKRVAKWHAPPRLVRDRQLVMSLERGRLAPYERSVIVRHARIEEWTAVADSSARMIEQELDYDPRR